MQQTPSDPALKAELTRCFAVHSALTSLTADVRVTVRGLPRLKSGQVQIALARPGCLRMEAQGPLRDAGTCLVVASRNFIYQANSTTKTYSTTSIPADGDALVYGLQEADILPLPVFMYLMADKEGVGSLQESFSSMTMTREHLFGAPSLLVFHLSNKGTKQTVRFGEKDGFLRQVVLTQGDVLIQEDYRGMQTNRRLPDSLWNFVPPRGFQDEANATPPPPPPPGAAKSLGAGSVAAPSGLQYLDVRKGTGKTVAKGMAVSVHYTGYFPDGKKFDSSLGGEPFKFQIPGPVIQGWNEGLLGMRVGGIRKLLIPPALGYGAEGAGGVIPPNATLYFEIELLSVESESIG